MEISNIFCIFALRFYILTLKLVVMTDPHRILFISQEIHPYLEDVTPIRVLNQQLPGWCQEAGFETRTFMPKFGEVNERRSQLHDVIRLSGANLIIDDADHPLLIKVATMPGSRVQVYFIDNDDYFHRRKGIAGDENGDFKDNDERCIFFTRGVLETVKKLRWTPSIVHCSGWMAALAPLYLKHVYADTPFFAHTKVVIAIDDNVYTDPFSTHFADKVQIEGIQSSHLRSIAGFPVGHEELMRLAIDNADAIICSGKEINQRIINYAETSGKPMLPYTEQKEDFVEFYQKLLVESEK